MAFCRASIKPVAVLRKAWNQAAYEDRGRHVLAEKDFEQDGQGVFKPAELTVILRCPLFRAYQILIVKIQLPPLRLTSWFEGCPCHEHIMMLQNETGKARRPARREAAMIDDGVEAGRCNLSSCRGVEAVDGNIEETLDAISDDVSKYFHSTLALKEQDGVTGTMSEQEKTLVIAEFTRAFSGLRLGVVVKFGWLKNLPWFLMGLAHHDLTRARVHGRRCLELYDRQTPSQRHRISCKFLSVG